jgi:hypothetical protein
MKHASEITGKLLAHLKAEGMDIEGAPERQPEEDQDGAPLCGHRPELRPEQWARDRGVPSNHLEIVYQDGPLEETHAMRGARRFMDAGIRALVLAGPPGVGKSVAGAWVASHASAPFERFAPGAFWIRAEDYVQASRKRDRLSGRAAGGNRDAMRKAEGAGILVLDDLGEEYADASGFSLHVLRSLITKRHDRSGCRIVVTTNLETGPFLARYGSRVADRLEGSGAWLKCAGETMRGRA